MSLTYCFIIFECTLLLIYVHDLQLTTLCSPYVFNWPSFTMLHMFIMLYYLVVIACDGFCSINWYDYVIFIIKELKNQFNTSLSYVSMPLLELAFQRYHRGCEFTPWWWYVRKVSIACDRWRIEYSMETQEMWVGGWRTPQ